MTLDLDEIARRRVRHDGDVGLSQGDFVMITPAERDWLVERAREAMRAQDGYVPPPVRLPEMPADVAGMVETLRQFANELSSPTIDDAATMIESLAGQRQEQDAWRANVEVKLRVTRQALNDVEVRAKQAEKELADERGKLNTVRRCLADREEIAQKDAARLAKLEAVVTALEPQTEWHSSERDGGPDVGILFKIDDKRSVWCGEISKDLFVESDAESLGDDHGWFIVLYDETKPLGQQSNLVAKAADQERGNTIARLIAIALAALDRKEPKT